MMTRPLPLLATLLALAPIAASQDQSLSLVNGVSAYVEVPHDASLVPASGITLEAWILYDGSTLGAGYRWPTVVRKNIAAGQESYFLRVNAANTGITTLRWKIVTSNGSFNVDWPFTPGALLSWTHVAATYDGTASRLFIGGNQVAQTPASGTLTDSGGVFRIGKGDDAGTAIETWNGQIDEVRLWPFARDAGQIQSTMALRLQGVPGGVSTWSLDGNGQESSLGSNGGTVVGPATFLPATAPTGPLANLGAINFGAWSTGCSAPVRAGIASPAAIGNAAFGVTCTGPSPAVPGALAFSAGTLVPPLQGSGVSLWIDPLSFFFYLIPVTTGPLGAVSVPLGLPADPLLLGVQLHAQFAFLDPCGTAGLITSEALTLTFQP